MNLNASVVGLAALGVLGLSGEARADINEVVEGTYSATCEQITLSAGIFESACENKPGSFLCSAGWVAGPFVAKLPCGVGDLATEVAAAHASCLEADLKVRDAEGNVLADVAQVVCDAAAGALLRAADDIETNTNGTYSINVRSNTWFSGMTGRFESQAGSALSLGYLTANFPWSSTFGFAMASGVGANVSLDGVCEGQARLTLMSGGTVDKETGALDLNYNLNGSLVCGELFDEALTVTVNMHSDVKGQKLD